ncbi:GNAT family N-acetyltransferase [Paractinoplanes lichenicola]|uniref:GNAT family N-acetyltransferase n=1 Tax=Paractinoplanes lichenicola TaxID=2802976 RepID=A0ABS1VL46_9ACTN|nr:GNAT family N-acetyltransferase [Actinoplanes lichenicola]MBL7255378.1 GNAT family N-acetyltransferase [Actinoplanes lichenicola]
MITRVTTADSRLFDLAAATFGTAPGGGRAFLESPGTVAFVAHDGDDVLGWCWGYHLVRPDTSAMLYLHRLEVRPEHRRQGIGRGLLRAFMSAGVRDGANRMFLTTGEANAAARALYESMGGGLATQGPTVNYWFELRADSPAVRPPACRALVLSGMAGVGKSTVAAAVGRAMTEAGQATAVVDTDQLAQFGPPPINRFAGYDELKCANLAAVWANFKAAGAQFLVVAAVIETAAVRQRYLASLADCEVRVVGLVADVGTVRDRLRRRDTGSKLERLLDSLDRQGLAPIDTAVADFTVTNDRPPAAIADEILQRAGWTGGVGGPT